MPPAAFGRKRKADPYAVPDEAPRYAIRTEQNVPGTWTTLDPTTGEFTFDRRYHEGNQEAMMFESRDYHPTSSTDADVITPADLLSARMESDENLLDDNRPRTDFQVRNSSVFAFGRNNDTIQIEIGGQLVSNKIGKGKFSARPGRPAQQMKKGQLEEYAIRRYEKEAEFKAYLPRMQEWEAMSPEEQERKKKEKRDKDLQQMENFRLTVVDTMPDEVTGVGVDLSYLSLDSSETQTAYSERTDTTAHKNSHPSHSVRKHRSGRPQHHRRMAPPSSSTERHNFNEPIGTPLSFSLAGRSLGSASHSRPSKDVLRVACHPDYFPLPRDLGPDHSLSNEPFGDSLVTRMTELSLRKGRMVTVRLDPKVTVPFPEAVTSRLWGGMIQEILFDTNSKHAVVVFVNVNAAAALLQHYSSIAKHNEMEFRRLQIAASWYEDAEPRAIFPAQQRVLQAISQSGATRVLIVKRVNNDLKKQEVEHEFRRTIGFERVICRGRLVVPTKLYERKEVRSNSLVVEFASIRDAVDVRAAIENNELGEEFDGCTARFGRDPVDAPSPTEFSFCNCYWCRFSRKQQAEARL